MQAFQMVFIICASYGCIIVHLGVGRHVVFTRALSTEGYAVMAKPWLLSMLVNGELEERTEQIPLISHTRSCRSLVGSSVVFFWLESFFLTKAQSLEQSEIRKRVFGRLPFNNVLTEPVRKGKYNCNEKFLKGLQSILSCRFYLACLNLWCEKLDRIPG